VDELDGAGDSEMEWTTLNKFITKRPKWITRAIPANWKLVDFGMIVVEAHF
jgi:hypothetical protein